jgi:hypothetical protein
MGLDLREVGADLAGLGTGEIEIKGGVELALGSASLWVSILCHATIFMIK